MIQEWVHFSIENFLVFAVPVLALMEIELANVLLWVEVMMSGSCWSVMVLLLLVPVVPL